MVGSLMSGLINLHEVDVDDDLELELRPFSNRF